MDVFNNSELHAKSRLRRLARGKNLFPARHNRTKNLLLEIGSYKKRMPLVEALRGRKSTDEEVAKAFNAIEEKVNTRQAKTDAVIQHNLKSMQAILIIMAIIESLVVSLQSITHIIARLLSVLSHKTATYWRGINDRIIDAMTFKNLTSKNLNILLFNFGVKHNVKKRLFATP
jgi:hypothetical protein